MQDQEDAKEPEETTEGADQELAEEATAEPAPETTEASPREPTDELKVVVIMKADRAMLGVQSPDCDPVYTTMEGSLDMALERVPSLVAEAKQKWEATPRYPKADLPEPPPSYTPARTPTAPKPLKQTAQKPMF